MNRLIYRNSHLFDTPLSVTSLELRDALQAAFSPEAAVECDICIALATPEEPLVTFAVVDGTIDFDTTLPADVTFEFPSVHHALELAFGQADPFAAFMAGEFRSDGHLLLVFLFLSLFRPGPRIEAPD